MSSFLLSKEQLPYIVVLKWETTLVKYLKICTFLTYLFVHKLLRMKSPLVLLSCCLTFSLLAQREATLWYFGYEIGFDFNSGEPVQTFDGVMATRDGSAVLCDPRGELLFYTNGGNDHPNTGTGPGFIWNRNHEVMYNMGIQQGGGNSAMQPAVIIPKPGVADQYYLFTMDHLEADNPAQQAIEPARGLSYFEIDMTRNGGFGEVTVANQRLYDGAYEGLCAIRHENKRDFWIIVNDTDSRQLLILSVTPDGVGALTPLFSPLFSQFSIKASPDGQFLAAIHQSVFLMKFDPATGTVEEDFELFDLGYTGEFSANSRYFYAYTTLPDLFPKIIQFDLEATDIRNSGQIIWENTGEASSLLFDYRMQLAPDANIYLLHDYNDQTYLSRINCPNESDAVLEFLEIPIQQQVADRPYNGLPNFPAYLFDLELRIDFNPPITKLCENSSVTLEPETNGLGYIWSTGDLTPSIDVTQTGWYYVTVTRGCEEVYDSIQVVGSLENQAIIGGPNMLCDVPFDTLFALVDDAQSYLWSDGSTAPYLIVDQPGTYGLTITDACGETVEVAQTITTAENPNLAGIQTTGALTCPGDEVVVEIITEPFNTIVWSTGATTPTVSINEPGTYEYLIKNECAELSGFVEIPQEEIPVYVPNAFSPNGDGINDTFGPFVKCTEVASYELHIFSRWGDQVFESTDVEEHWTGDIAGEKADVGIYSWALSVSVGPRTRRLSGDLLLVR